jgi:hypothetical protein
MGRKFELDDMQQARADAWFKHHWEVIHANFHPREMSGAAVKFTIIPTGCGDNIDMECIWCKEGMPAQKVVLTVGDDGEFIFEYDADWNKLKASWER